MKLTSCWIKTLIVTAVAGAFMTSPVSLSAQFCDWDVGIYAGVIDYPDEEMTEVYGYAWDNSPCAGQCGHSGGMTLSASYDFGGGTNYYSGAGPGSLVFSTTTTGSISFESILSIWCNCSQSYGGGYVADVAYIQRPQGCGDERDTIIAEYRNGGSGYPAVNWVPSCGDFATGGGTDHFSWSEVNHGTGSGHQPWGIASMLDQLEATRLTWGDPITVQSGYRCPHGNHAVGGAQQSRHMWGDAADVTVSNWSQSTWEALRLVALDNGFSWYEPWEQDPTHLHVDRR